MLLPMLLHDSVSTDPARDGVGRGLTTLLAHPAGTSSGVFWGALAVWIIASIIGVSTARTAPGPAVPQRWTLRGIQVAALVLAFGALTYEVHIAGPLTDADPAVLDSMVAHRTAPLTAAAIAITECASPAVILVLAAAIGYLWWRRTGSLLPAAVLVGTLCAAAGAETVIKSLVGRARPPQATQVLFETGHSFPSGHATCATALFLLAAMTIGSRLSPVRRGVLVFVAACAAVLVAATRVYLGEHWLTDVVGGVLLGMLAASAGSMLFTALAERYGCATVDARHRRAPNVPSLDATR